MRSEHEADRITPAEPSDGNRARIVRQYLSDRAHRAWLVKVARRIEPGDAEDAVHDGIVHALSAKTAFRGDASVSTWLYRVVSNAALMRRRGQEAARRSVSRAGADPTGVPWIRGEWTGPDPETALERAADAARIRAAIEALPPIYKETSLAYLLAGEEGRTAAMRLGVGESTLRTRAERARRLLVRAVAA